MGTPGKYREAWNALKNRGKIVLASPSSYHKRIIKGLNKEKNKDLAFKFVLSESNQRAVFTSKSDGSKITLFLRVESTALDLSKV